MSVKGIFNEIGFLKVSDIRGKDDEIPCDDIKVECELLIPELPSPQRIPVSRHLAVVKNYAQMISMAAIRI